MVRRAALALTLALSPLAVEAAPCRLALVLALDVSSSVDKVEYALQSQGLAAALVSPEVSAAFLRSPAPVALSVFEWSGRYNQALVLDWTLIQSRAHLLYAAEQIISFKRSHDDFPTAMGYALGYAAQRLSTAPPCDAQVIDLSGDGKNNEGFPPASAYRAYTFDGVTVNGLAINAADFEGEIDLLPYFRREVLHGAGAFLEVASGFEDFERAMRRKLEREVAPPLFGAMHLP